jgi:hypothetical protein
VAIPRSPRTKVFRVPAKSLGTPKIRYNLDLAPLAVNIYVSRPKEDFIERLYR